MQRRAGWSDLFFFALSAFVSTLIFENCVVRITDETGEDFYFFFFEILNKIPLNARSSFIFIFNSFDKILYRDYGNK